MDKIDEQLKNLLMADVPTKVHNSVMEKIKNSRLIPMLFVIFGILLVSFLAIIFYINSRLIDTEFVDMLRDFFGVFDFGFDFISISVSNFFEIISPIFIILGALILVGAIYIVRKITLYKL